MDKILYTRATKKPDVEKLVEEFYEVLEATYRSSFQTSRVTKTTSTCKTVPWWSEELTIMRKMLNALRPGYQRTRDSEDLRCQRRAQYLEAKTKYAAKIKKEKRLSWKEYRNMTPYPNPWNEVYRLAAGKRKNATQLTILGKPDGSLTADLHETLKYMLEHFAPETTITTTPTAISKPELYPKNQLTRKTTKTSPSKKLGMQ